MPTLVQTQNATSTNSGSTLPVTVTSTGSGNLLFVGISTGGTVSSVSDGTNTYTQIDVIQNGNRLYGFYAANISSGITTVTVHCSNGSGIVAIVREYSGLTTTPLDKHTIQSQSFDNPASSGATATTTQASELVIGYIGSNGSDTFSLGSGYGNLVSQDNGFVNAIVGLEDATVSSTGAQTATFGTGGGGTYVVGVATFKAASGGATLSINVNNSITTSESITLLETSFINVSNTATTSENVPTLAVFYGVDVEPNSVYNNLIGVQIV